MVSIYNSSTGIDRQDNVLLILWVRISPRISPFIWIKLIRKFQQYYIRLNICLIIIVLLSTIYVDYIVLKHK
jgi:hypothetical protein